MIWLLVITMDFLLEFRFEFLWPLWLLIRTIYDSFKYQGLVILLFMALYSKYFIEQQLDIIVMSFSG